MSEPNITEATVRASMENVHPVLEALSILLKEVSVDAVRNVAAVLATLGVDPTTLPGEYLMQSMLVEADRLFVAITRENWIRIYDAYQQVKAIVDSNPDLKKQFGREEATTPEAPPEQGGLLDGDF